MATTIVTKNSSTAAAVPTAGQLVQGELAVNVADKRLFTEDNGGTIVEVGTNPSTLTVTGEITANGGIAFGDNDKATFGASDDLQIYHDGGNSLIEESGVGNLIIRGSGNVDIQPSGGGAYMARFAASGASSLYYNGAEKLATTATGIDISGTATMDGLNVGDNQWIYAGNGADLKIGHDGADSIIRAQGSPLYIDANGTTFRGYSPYTKHMDIASNGDISFYEDTGTTPKLFWDASAESLGIGTSSPAAKAHIVGAANAIALKVTNAAVDGNNADVMHIEPSNGAYVGKLLRIQSGRSDFSDSLLFLNTTTGMNGTNGSYMRVQNNLGADVFRIKGDGNVGIGTSSPAAKLQVEGETRIYPASGTAILRFGSGGAEKGKLSVDASSNMAFETANSERMRIDSSGNVGINNSNPSSYGKFVVDGTGNILNVNATSGSALLQLYEGGSGRFGIQTLDGSAGAKFTVAGTERMRIDSSGNVGIGGNGTGNGLGVYLSRGTGANFFEASDGTKTMIAGSDSSQDFVKIGSLSAHPVGFVVGNGERMRIDASGRLLVGTTAPVNGSTKAEIRCGAGEIALETSTTGDGYYAAVFYNASNASVGYIYTSATSTDYNTSSDYRLKENIADADDAGSKIDAIQVRQYDWKVNGSHQDYGMIAQELQLVAPEAVSGDADSEDMMGVDYSKLVPMLIKEIQSLRNRVAQLEG